MFTSVAGAYLAMSDSSKTYLRDLWLSESDALRETYVFDGETGKG